MTKTTFATLEDHREAMGQWFLVDASRHVLGRMAAAVAEVLMGKHTPRYTPHLNVGHGVIVINARKVRTTGDKRHKKVYRHYTGYPGGLRETNMAEYLERHPEELIKNAVRRMLPKTRMGRQMLRRLKVYAGPTHEHQAQKPVELTIRG